MPWEPLAVSGTLDSDFDELSPPSTIDHIKHQTHL